MFTNTQHQTPEHRPIYSSAPTELPTPLDRRPYWNETIAAFSNSVWLPIGTADHSAAINRAHGWASKTAANSWFSTNRISAPNPGLHTLYSPTAVQATTVRTTAGASKRQARRIQVYPDTTQKLAIATWLTASRWTYNLTVEILQSGIPAVWKHIASMVMPEVKALHPEWDSVPYQVKRTAVRDACRAMSNVKTFNLELKSHQAQGNRTDEEFAQLGYRSRKNPKQSCYIPDDAVTEHGVYHTILGPLRMAEAIPAGQQECRLVKERGLYWLVVPYPAQCDIETPSGDGVVALDPGVRTFLTYFSETDCGKLGHHAFGRIQRLCHWLDDLISRTAKEPNRRKRRQMRSAQARMRQRITNLVDELHWQLARWLTSNYRIILLPTFETHDMTQRAGRKNPQQDRPHDAHLPPLRVQATPAVEGLAAGCAGRGCQRGIHQQDAQLGRNSQRHFGRRQVQFRDESGFGMDRDVNGARGIFLRALGDSPFLRGLLTQVASQTTASA